MMAILLIGSTGSGKSTLGNYLIDPSDVHMFDKPTFAMQRSRKPCTDQVQKETFEFGSNDLQNTFNTCVIDTPGLNESPEADTRHMMNVLEAVENAEGIKACIFVVKFDAIIDAQYVATVKYYSNLLPQLFENNLVVVMTGFSMNERQVKLRERQGIVPEKIKENVLNELIKTGCSSYKPAVFMLDCQVLEDEDSAEPNQIVRESILSYIHAKLPTIPVQDIKVHKTASMIEYDQILHDEIEQKIKKENLEIFTSTTTNQELVQEIMNIEDLIRTKVHELKENELDLMDKDTEELVAIRTYNMEQPKTLGVVSTVVRLESNFQIIKVDTWARCNCEWKGISVKQCENEEEKYCFQGEVHGSFMRGVSASVTLQTEKRIKYASEIAQQKETCKSLKKEIHLLDDNLEEIRKCNVECEAQIRQLQENIEHQKAQLRITTGQQWITVGEAKERLGKELEHLHASTK